MTKLTKALERIRHVAEVLDDDDPDKIEMLNMEGDYADLMEWALNKRNEALALGDGCKQLASVYSARSARLTKKGDSFKGICGILLDCAGETKFVGSGGTVSSRQAADKVEVSDEDKLPAVFIKTSTSVDKAAINKAIKAGISVDGVTVTAGGKTISIRVK